MKKKFLALLLIFGLMPLLFGQGTYRMNRYTGRMDYYEPVSSADLGDLSDVVFTLSATGNLIYYNGTNWVNLATGANGRFLQLVAGVPVWVNVGAVPVSTVQFSLVVANAAGGWVEDTAFKINAGDVTTGVWQATAIAPDFGGTGLSAYTIGDLIVADGVASLAKLPDVAVNQVLVSGGVGVAPAYSASPTLSGATFTGTVIGVSPTVHAHLAIKEYVDDALGATLDYFFNNTASNIDQETETTYNMEGVIYAGEETLSRATITAVSDQLLFVFATLSGQPGLFDLVAGVYASHMHLAISGGGARDVDVYWTLSTVDNDGTNEVLLMTSEIEVGVSGGETTYTIHAILGADVEIGATSRFLWKLYGNGDLGNDATMAFHLEGNTGTHLSIRAPSAIFNTIYVRQDGTTPITELEVLGRIIETVNAHSTVSSGTEDFDLDDGSYHTVTTGGDFVVTFSNWPAGGKVSSITIKLINAGAHTITWPGVVDWPGGIEPVWTVAGTDFAIFFSDDGGTIVYGSLSLQDVK